ncbi:MAG: GAF domain-containing protein, partial [Candidatus Rokubacteria bacterium]|nr:GAF domain-containing protein [Candidatus Rokubacteria bacterium]
MRRRERSPEARQTAFVEIVKELAAEDDPERLFARIGERVCQLLGTDSASLCVVEGDELAVRAACGLEGPLHGAPRRKIAESPVGRVVLTRRAYATADMTRDPHWRGSEVVTRWGYRAILEVPVVLRGEVIGAMAALDKAPRKFSGEDTALLSALADHTALALERARLIGETQAQRQEAEVLAELASTITASLDLDTVLERVAKGARELCGSDMADPDSDAMVLRYLVGTRYQQYDTFRIEAGKGSGGLVVSTGCPFRTDDYAADPRISKDYLEVAQVEGIVAELVVPIQIEGRVEGLLFVQNRAHRPFTDRDEAILVRLADHAAIAIKNARLYGELRAALEAVEASQQ